MKHKNAIFSKLIFKVSSGASFKNLFCTDKQIYIFMRVDLNFIQ